MRLLQFTFDVTDLTPAQECLLVGEVECQAERTKDDGQNGGGKPDVQVVTRSIEFPRSLETRTSVGVRVAEQEAEVLRRARLVASWVPGVYRTDSTGAAQELQNLVRDIRRLDMMKAGAA